MTTGVDLTGGPADTVIAPPPAVAAERLDHALAAPIERRRDAVADVVRAYPEWSEAWARLGELARDDVEAYACFRAGYHRGLDGLRRAGWRGSGYVRWVHAGNRGFLRCLAGLQSAAAAIGEPAEQERCRFFLHQCDPQWPPGDLTAVS